MNWSTAMLLCLFVARQTEPSLEVHGKRLVLDSRIVDRVEDARLTVGQITRHPRNPLFREELPWEVRFDNLYANVIRDDADGLYKCWYSPFLEDAAVQSTPSAQRATVHYPRAMKQTGGHRLMGVCYAQSRDGLTWEKPLMDICLWKGKPSNILVVGPHGTGVVKDSHDPDPARRYKMFYVVERNSMAVAFSADGLHWSKPTPCPDIRAKGDTHNLAFWNPTLNRYVGITRLWDGRQRLVGHTQSDDFLHWTQAVDVFHGQPDRQIYAMPVFAYAGLYLGLPMIFDHKQDRVWCELAWSPDTIQWHRVDEGKPLIGNSPEPGAYDWGCVYAAATPIILDHEIRLYYGASNGPHTDWRDGFLALATLRPDGFAGYESLRADAPARLTTHPLIFPSPELCLTADAQGGAVTVAVLDAQGRIVTRSEPVVGNVTDAAVRWLDTAALVAQQGKPLRLQFQLDRARLYALRWAE